VSHKVTLEQIRGRIRAVIADLDEAIKEERLPDGVAFADAVIAVYQDTEPYRLGYDIGFEDGHALGDGTVSLIELIERRRREEAGS